MNLSEVKKSIEKQLSRELRQGSKRNIVFWYDEEGAFSDDIDSLELANAKIIKLYDNNAFATKLYLEDTDKESNLLVYSPLPRPSNIDNWLTDTIRYSQTFSTDETSLNLLNFKIDSSLRHVVEQYKAFFRSNERCKRFESYGLEPYSETKIDIGVMSAICKLPAPNFDNVVKTLLIETTDNETTLIDSVSKLANGDKLWDLIQKSYGYNFPEQSFEKLSIMLLVTHLSHSLNGNMPKEWEEHVSTNTNCFVFVDNLMKNTQHLQEYNMLASLVADKINIAEKLSELGASEIINCDTFDYFDKNIIQRISENIVLDIGEYSRYRKTINNRRNRRYFKEFENEYSILLSACDFLMLRQNIVDLKGDTTAQMFENYTKQYFKFDLYYRQFIAQYDKLDDSDRFKELFDKIENTYTNWFLNELSVKWCALLDEEKKWEVVGVTPQQKFYDTYVRKFVRDNERIIVVISDALRYESATELLKTINTEQAGSSELFTMLGVIPSYTKLGMGALLPHKKIEITDKADVLIDEISTQGTENREKILKTFKPESVAVTYDNLTAMSSIQMKEKFSGVKLIYIYHNTIDARGDNAGTEKEVFEATEKCFKELSQLIKTLKNNISAINIILTADHGYIYRRTPLSESDKTPKEATGSIEAKRRFILTKENTEIQSTQKFNMGYINTQEDDINAIIPRGANCFKVQGSGTNYVHGGTSLQEVVIPVITFKSDKNSNKSMSAKKVSVILTSLTRKITSVITYLSFFQNEMVEDKILPLRVTVYFADADGNRISNENIIIAESTSFNPTEREYKEKFTLKDMHYDKTKEYFLVLRDEDELVNKEIERIPFNIDLVFGGSIKF